MTPEVGLDPVVEALVCAVCGYRVDVATPLTWRCPHATADQPHLLRFARALAPLRPRDDANPFVAFRPYLAWDAFAAAAGLSPAERDAVVRALDADIARVGAVGFVWTPLTRSAELSSALGFSADGGVWVKDETANVAGSHKARHLMTIALHLVVAERRGLTPWGSRRDRPMLAIASCGNAALAAATIAAALEWPISVFVPEWANEAVVARLGELGATIVRCPRRHDDPPGDPCVLRFRDAVSAGAVPFAVQGPENAWCLDGGRTIGWELAWQFAAAHPAPLAALFVQVGGGALASSAWQGASDLGPVPALRAVQTQGCAPLARAWQRAKALPGGVAGAARHWRDCMWPWESEPHSLAEGILDDETYDWVPVVEAMEASGGSPVVASEALIEQAWSLGRRATGIEVSATGTAGLAGLMAVREDYGDDDNVVVIFSGVER